MKIIKSFFRKSDIFGVPYSFTYKNEYKYSTPIGGFSFLLYCIVILVILIYKFIPFYYRKNFSIIHYIMTMQNTEHFNLEESKLTFALGLDCEVDTDGTKAEDLFKLEFNFITYTRDKNGNRNKSIEILSAHPCRYEDFYNNYNDSIDFLGLSSFYCLDKKDQNIEGIFSDQLFTYYQFSVYSKDFSENNFLKIDNYLSKNDCKFSFYYTDISIDINNYSYPVRHSINTYFLQLSPILFLKTNIYFMNQYFSDDKLLLFDEEDNTLVQSLFSRYESYSQYKGLNRSFHKSRDYNYYGNIYIRADTQRSEIKRQYQKITEFYAGVSSLFVLIYYSLSIIINFINSFYAELSISKKIFLFKEIEDNKIDFIQKNKKIKKLIFLTEPIVKQMDKHQNKLIRTSFIKEVEFSKELTNELKTKKLTEEKEVKKEEEINKNNSELQKIKITDREKIIFKNYNNSQQKNLINVKLESNNQIKRGVKKKEELKKNNFKQINFSFNLYEIITTSFLRLCMTKNMILKNKLKIKANNFLNKKLDIIVYIRNMIIFDLVNQIILDDNKKDIINFLSRPKLSINNKEKNEFDKFYVDYYENDFDKFLNRISQLTKNKYKFKKEKKFIYLINQDLKLLL